MQAGDIVVLRSRPRTGHKPIAIRLKGLPSKARELLQNDKSRALTASSVEKQHAGHGWDILDQFGTWR